MQMVCQFVCPFNGALQLQSCESDTLFSGPNRPAKVLEKLEKTDKQNLHFFVRSSGLVQLQPE